MASEFPNDTFSLESLPVSAWKKQGELVRFLVNEYYTKPCNTMECEKRTARSGIASDVPFREAVLSDEVAVIIGNICQRTNLLDQKHVVDRPPFSLFERPLIIPAMIGALLQRFLYEEYGVFVSSIAFDSWAAKAMGFAMRISRVWLDADLRVQQALRNSSAEYLLRARNACDTGVHAIEMQSHERGALYTMWSATCNLLSTALATVLPAPENTTVAFFTAMCGAIALRKAVHQQQSSKKPRSAAANTVLYSASEPELCGCVTFHSCYNELNALFGATVTSREQKEASSTLMRELFQGCLNAFSFNSFTAKKTETAFRTLDAVVEVVEGKRVMNRSDLRLTYPPSPLSYLQRVVVLTCDEICNDVNEVHRANGKTATSPISLKRTFSEMNVTALDLRRLFPFSKPDCTGYELRRECSKDAVFGDEAVESCEDWVDYSESTTVTLAIEDGDCIDYVLSAKERAAKQLVYAELYGVAKN